MAAGQSTGRFGRGLQLLGKFQGASRKAKGFVGPESHLQFIGKRSVLKQENRKGEDLFA